MKTPVDRRFPRRQSAEHNYAKKYSPYRGGWTDSHFIAPTNAAHLLVTLRPASRRTQHRRPSCPFALVFLVASSKGTTT